MDDTFREVLLSQLRDYHTNEGIVDGTILQAALEKRDRRITRYGDEEGMRLQPYYLKHLINESIYEREMMKYFHGGVI